MGQKSNPIGLRLGIIKGWDSNWYGGRNFSEKLIEDQNLRGYIRSRIPKGGISKIVIERTLKRITLTIHTARPGVVIGKGGAEVDKIKEEFKNLTYGYQLGAGVTFSGLTIDVRYEGNFSKSIKSFNIDGKTYEIDDSPSRVIFSLWFKL